MPEQEPFKFGHSGRLRSSCRVSEEVPSACGLPSSLATSSAWSWTSTAAVASQRSSGGTATFVTPDGGDGASSAPQRARAGLHVDTTETHVSDRIMARSGSPGQRRAPLLAGRAHPMGASHASSSHPRLLALARLAFLAAPTPSTSWLGVSVAGDGVDRSVHAAAGSSWKRGAELPDPPLGASRGAGQDRLERGLPGERRGASSDRDRPVPARDLGPDAPGSGRLARHAEHPAGLGQDAHLTASGTTRRTFTQEGQPDRVGDGPRSGRIGICRPAEATVAQRGRRGAARDRPDHWREAIDGALGVLRPRR